MRTRFSCAMQEELKKGMKQQKYRKVLDALNVLGNTGWKINRQVYDVINNLWEKQSTAGGLPQQIPLKPPSPPPTHYSRLERRGHVLAADEVRRLNRNMASLKADFLLKLKASKYLADLTMDAIGEMFSSARAIMGWLAACAKVVATANVPVRWTSPLGLPITQPYHKQAIQVVQTTTQSFTVRVTGAAGFLGGGYGQGLGFKQVSVYDEGSTTMVEKAGGLQDC
eukprot:gene2259-2572_t